MSRATEVTAEVSSLNLDEGGTVEFVVSVSTPGCRSSRGRFEVTFVVALPEGGEKEAVYRGDWRENGSDSFDLDCHFGVGRSKDIVSSDVTAISAVCE